MVNSNKHKAIIFGSGLVYRLIIEDVYNLYEVITILDNDMWEASTTTGKYRNKFLNCDKDEILKNIADGSILLMNLNK